MNVIFILARIALVVVFLASGAQKLMDINMMAGAIEGKVAVPQEFRDMLTPLLEATGLSFYQLAAVLAGALEVLASLMIVFGFGMRPAAVALILFTAATTYFYHDFWNMADQARMTNMIAAQKNLAIIGGLLLVFAMGSWRPVQVYARDEPGV